MTKILFICHGNICRSPMAEFILKDMVTKKGLEESFVIASAATSGEEIGTAVHPGTKNKLRQVGISSEGKTARKLTKGDYSMHDHLICMDDDNIRNCLYIVKGDPKNKVKKLLDFTKRGGDIADPWYTDNFDETYTDIVEGCEGLLAHLGY